MCICAYQQDKHGAGRHPGATKLRRQLLLATCAVCPEAVAQIQLHIRQQEALHVYITARAGADNPALAMLVEPLLSLAWRKQLDKQRFLKGDEDTDLFSTGIAEQNIQQASEEEGLPLQDKFVVLEGPGMAKLSLKLTKVSAALDMIPVSKRQLMEQAVGHAIGQGLDSVTGVLQRF